MIPTSNGGDGFSGFLSFMSIIIGSWNVTDAMYGSQRQPFLF